MSPLFCFLWISLIHLTLKSNGQSYRDVDCVTVSSGNYVYGATQTVSCSDAGDEYANYVMTGCGWESAWSHGGESFINTDDECIATPSPSSGRVRAVAQCCDISEYVSSSSCSIKLGTDTTESMVTATCNDGDVVVGCVAHGESCADATNCNTAITNLEGAITNQSCTGHEQYNTGSTVSVQSVCCTKGLMTAEIECKQIIGDLSINRDDAISSISCTDSLEGSGWFLTSCNEYTTVSNPRLDGHYTINDDECWAHNSGRNSAGVRAVAQCCRIATIPTASPTASPTKAPTETPSVSPTEAPSISPTEAPTGAPTDAPSTSPTESPTEAPSISPTEAPTRTPTEAPSTSPTESPSTSPTEAPTEAPSTSPTDAPSISPTGSPSISPTEAPTGAPTDAPSTSPTDAPSASPTESPSLAPTEAPTATPTDAPSSSPTMDGCDFDLDTYLEECYCDGTQSGFNLGSAHSNGGYGNSLDKYEFDQLKGKIDELMSKYDESMNKNEENYNYNNNMMMLFIFTNCLVLFAVVMMCLCGNGGFGGIRNKHRYRKVDVISTSDDESQQLQ